MAGSTNGSTISGSGISTAALTAAIALVVAGLAAVGLTGDALLRAVRNEPVWIAVCLSVAVVGGGLVVFGQLLASKQPVEGIDQTKRQRRVWWLSIIGLILIVVPTIAAISLGARAVGDRELPLVTLQAAPVEAAPSAASAGSKAGTIEITVTARAVGMTTNNDLLVQVLGLYSDPAALPTPASSGSPLNTPSPSPGLAMPSVEVQICESNHTWPQSAKDLDPTKRSC